MIRRIAIVVMSDHPDIAEFTIAASAGLAADLDVDDHMGQIYVLDVDDNKKIIDSTLFGADPAAKDENEDEMKGAI